MKRTPRHFEEPLINLTPLIDVVFVILIMFIVVAPLLEIDQIELAQSYPEKEVAFSLAENSLIAISVHADNTIYYNKQPVNLEELESQLCHANAQHSNTVPQLFQDKKASFGTYQSVKNAAEKAGFKQLDVILKP